ncbi:MAG: hypothetical protein JWR63_2843 [Conexibacter sp.]|nr:hypothetical protein [Conexibacter sp.]
MSADENDDIIDEPRPEAAEPEAASADVVEQGRRRPPDLVGTRPEWDPATLLPNETPRAAAGRLWAPAAAGSDGEDTPGDDREAAGAGATATATDSRDDASDTAGAPAYSRYSARFQFLLGALLAVGVSALALLVAVLVTGKDDKTIVLRNGPAWSAWRPTAATGADAAQQIAEHVGRQYRLADGKQLVLVDGGPLQIAELPVTIAIQQPAAKGGNIDFVTDGAGVMYRLCGVGGTDCTIVDGKPSVSRHLLLRREALELALYSFRYLGVSETVVLLPPGVSKKRNAAGRIVTSKAAPTALLFRRSQPDVQAALARPLTRTLADEAPSVNAVKRSANAGLVDALTTKSTYTFRFQQSNQDARAYLVLNPLALR